MVKRKMTEQELYTLVKRHSTSLFLDEIYEMITQKDFDDEYANLIKVELLKDFGRMLDGMEFSEEESKVTGPKYKSSGNYDFDELKIITYCYYTSSGKQATEAKKRFRPKLVRRIAFMKLNDGAPLLEEDAGESYSRWRSVWAKEQDKYFIIHYGKDPAKWLPRIKERFIVERKRAEEEGLF